VLGASTIGGVFRPVDDATATTMLEAAWSSGLRRYDTAPHYGAGLSEHRLGAFLRQFPRDSYRLSTKVGRLLVDTDEDTEGVDGFFGAWHKRRVRDYSAAGVRRSLAESLERMGLDRVDTLLIHDPDDYLDQAIGEAYPALHELRSQGVISSVGAGMNYSAPLTRFVRETEVDTVMVAGRYTLLDHSAQEDLMPACVERGVSVLAAAVFNSGVLADPKPGAMYDYAEASPEILARAQQIKDICDQHGVDVRAAGIQFPLQHPAVDAVAVGARTDTQVRSNIKSLKTEIPQSLWDEVAAVR
jgi:D-threo-aldose 1-dehydrogenase